MLRLISKIVLVFLAIISIILLGFYFIPPKQQAYNYEYITDNPDKKLKDIVGWYVSSAGKEYQVTWNAKQGLQFNHFHPIRDSLIQLFLDPIDIFRYDINGNDTDAEAIFVIDSITGVTSLSLDHKDIKILAIKDDNIYYDQEEITYFNDSITLTGLLLIPKSQIKNKAVVMIHGSGISDRNNFWYMYQADFLAKNGYVVLLADKRGCGKSFGTWHDAGFDDFAGDVIAGIQYLKNNHPEKASNVAIMGLSQGGWISHLAAEKSQDVNYIIDVVSSATTPNEQVQHEVFNDIKNAGAPQFIASLLSPIFTKRAKAKRNKWWNQNGNFNPLELISASQKPLLKIFGEDDEFDNLPVQKSIVNMNNLIDGERKRNIVLKVYEGSGHGLFHSGTGWIRTDYLQDVVNWLESQ